MHSLIVRHRGELDRLCARFRVERLELFGSAATPDHDEVSSDFDFLVEFEDLEPSAYAEAYFGLLDALGALFGHPVDLVTISAIKNPYFLRGIQPSRTLLYAA